MSFYTSIYRCAHCKRISTLPYSHWIGGDMVCSDCFRRGVPLPETTRTSGISLIDRSLYDALEKQLKTLEQENAALKEELDAHRKHVAAVRAAELKERKRARIQAALKLYDEGQPIHTQSMNRTVAEIAGYEVQPGEHGTWALYKPDGTAIVTDLVDYSADEAWQNVPDFCNDIKACLTLPLPVSCYWELTTRSGIPEDNMAYAEICVLQGFYILPKNEDDLERASLYLEHAMIHAWLQAQAYLLDKSE